MLMKLDNASEQERSSADDGTDSNDAVDDEGEDKDGDSETSGERTQSQADNDTNTAGDSDADERSDATEDDEPASDTPITLQVRHKDATLDVVVRERDELHAVLTQLSNQLEQPVSDVRVVSRVDDSSTSLRTVLNAVLIRRQPSDCYHSRPSCHMLRIAA